MNIEPTVVVRRPVGAPIAPPPVATKKEEPVKVSDRQAELQPQDRQGRPVRIPIGKQDKINFPQRPGYVRRFVNDVKNGDRIKMFELAGYKKVEGNLPGGDTAAGADSQMGTGIVRSAGGGIKGVLMEIPEEYYKEDQAAKAEADRDRERTIMERHKQPDYCESDRYGPSTIKRR